MTLAYALPAALVWGVLGLTLGSIRAGVPMAIAATCYSALFGASEALALRLRAPTVTWQVPAEWVVGRGPVRRTVVWGAILGPGLMTRNPYAAMWLIPLLLTLTGGAVAGMLTGVAAGALHGAMRAGGVMLNATRLRGDVHRALLASFGWRMTDGLVLLIFAGYLGIRLIGQ